MTRRCWSPFAKGHRGWKRTAYPSWSNPSRKGVLARSMRLMPLLSRFMPKPKANATVAEQIAMPRKMFGEYKGDYVVTGGVDTRHVTVESADGYQVPVRI